MNKANYILKYREKGIWDIYAPNQEDKKPVISIKANQNIAKKVISSLNKGDGLPISERSESYRIVPSIPHQSPSHA